MSHNFDLLGIDRWGSWVTNVTADQEAVSLLPGGLVRDQTIDVHGVSDIMLRAFGKDTDDDIADVEIIGWMGSDRNTSTGYGKSLWKGRLFLGASTGSFIPLDDGNWGDDPATWFEVDTWSTAISGGHNRAQASSLTGADQTDLIFPTSGYTQLQATVTNIGGSSPEQTELGIMFRAISKGGVV